MNIAGHATAIERQCAEAGCTSIANGKGIRSGVSHYSICANIREGSLWFCQGGLQWSSWDITQHYGTTLLQAPKQLRHIPDPYCTQMYLFALFMRVLLSWFPSIDWNTQPWTFLRLVRTPNLADIRERGIACPSALAPRAH